MGRSFEKGLAGRGGWREEVLTTPEIQASILYPFAYATCREGEHNSGHQFSLYFGPHSSPTPSRQPLFETSDLFHSRAPKCGSGPNCPLEGKERTPPSSHSPFLPPPSFPLPPTLPVSFCSAPGGSTAKAGVGEGSQGSEGWRGRALEEALGPRPTMSSGGTWFIEFHGLFVEWSFGCLLATWSLQGYGGPDSHTHILHDKHQYHWRRNYYILYSEKRNPLRKGVTLQQLIPTKRWDKNCNCNRHIRGFQGKQHQSLHYIN